ncbi:MAG TPA: 50S ribosomal protein L15 [Spirochaetota bacterium]|nr:50S ribosomal protein L15 [Spirochaetota bacterium]HPC41037.1 50S ribosomal protein L15 [Spirochaetota bacterium]HPL16923.1 50S ribosomal protein L15 [Spirochaetota bacterium]HQF08850.1 50S ribosomal protein L15 [Spirochaetota bacterium]HQH97469.1 50S ribosomal protein L15 [Spirochaetota bacterium]
MEGIYSLKKPDCIKRRKRVGRGNSSGHGSQSGKGHDGQLGRAGRKRRAWFEGGQMPLQRRIPKRGFANYTKKEYQVVNIALIEKLGLSEINPEVLKQQGAITRVDRLVKVLGKGDITRAVKVTADSFSGSAMEKIKNAGGEANLRAKTENEDN